MGDPIRIRTRVNDGVTDVVVLMPHPMETGLRKNDSGSYVPAHYITDVVVSLGTRVVLSAKMSIAVSTDPLLKFRFRGGRPGDRLTVSWTDNRGDRRIDEVMLT
jgi:sulfur-oxidizing protein SoxZ